MRMLSRCWRLGLDGCRAADAVGGFVTDAVVAYFDSDSSLKSLLEWLVEASSCSSWTDDASVPLASFPAPSAVKSLARCGKIESSVRDAARDVSLSDSDFTARYFTNAISPTSRGSMPAFRSLCAAGAERGIHHWQWHDLTKLCCQCPPASVCLPVCVGGLCIFLLFHWQSMREPAGRRSMSSARVRTGVWWLLMGVEAAV